MVGFAEYTNTYETRLGRVPFYRKGARGPDQLSTFASKKNAEYWANAGRIRDMRFAQANEYNIDRAIRSQRERYISNAMDTVADTRELEGLRGRTSMKLSRTGGALSRYGTPSVVKGEMPMSLTVAGLAMAMGFARYNGPAHRRCRVGATLVLHLRAVLPEAGRMHMVVEHGDPHRCQKAGPPRILIRIPIRIVTDQSLHTSLKALYKTIKRT